MVPFNASDPVSSAFGSRISAAIEEFLQVRTDELAGISSELDIIARLARDFTSGGKRLRPAFCYWGYVAAAGQPADPDPLLRAAASFDLLHVSALVHDDVMDASDSRRGMPSVHRQFETLHAERGLRGSAEAYGRAAAILLGDLLLVWSEQLWVESRLPPQALARAWPYLAAIRTEVTAGQLLDMFAQSSDPLAEGRALLDDVARVVEYKTARYTVQRPVQIGAVLADGRDDLVAALARFGSPLGRAFQYRDDLLGVFGDAALTGKPAGDDIREGKLTVLIAHALQKATPSGRERLAGLLGTSKLSVQGLADARTIIIESGAAAATEAAIERGHAEAVRALDGVDMHPDGRLALLRLAELSVTRDR